MKWKRKNQTDRLYKNNTRVQAVVKKSSVEGQWDIRYRDVHGHWTSSVSQETKEAAKKKVEINW